MKVGALALNTVEPCFIEDIMAMKVTLLYQEFSYISVKKQPQSSLIAKTNIQQFQSFKSKPIIK